MKKFFSWAEVRNFYSIGLPIFIAQLTQTGMNFADTAMTGRFNAEDMAAVALAGAVWAPVALLGIGCLMALPALSAQMVGAGKREETAHLLRQGIWLTFLISLPLMAFFHFVSWHFTSFGLEQKLADLAGGYLRALLWGLPGFMLFVNQRSFYEGFSRTRPAMIVGILGLCLNVPCNYILIYGKLGLPAMGAVGCGIASAVCYWFMALCMYIYLRFDVSYRDLRPLLSFFQKRTINGAREQIFDRHLLWRAFVIGFPSAIALFFDVSLFAMSAIIISPYGTTTVAAHQIALNFGGLLFMAPLAIGMTCTIRVGYCLGGKNAAQARVVALTGLILAVSFCALECILTIILRRHIAMIYNEDPAVVALAITLLLFLGAYQVIDAVQMTGIGVLRGYNDTRIISIICFVAYMLIGLPLGFILSRTDLLVPAMGAPGFWIAFLASLVFGASCYWLRVRYLFSLPPKEVFARVSK